MFDRDAKPVETLGLIHHEAGHRTPVRIYAIPLRDRHGSIIGIIQTFEEHFALAGPDANNQSMKERGWLDEVTGLPNQAVMQSHLRFEPAHFADRAIHRKKGRR